MFQRILVPVDLSDSETGKKTLAVASEIAQASEGQLRIVYVRYMMELAMSYIPANTLEADERSSARQIEGACRSDHAA